MDLNCDTYIYIYIWFIYKLIGLIGNYEISKQKGIPAVKDFEADNKHKDFILLDWEGGIMHGSIDNPQD